MLHFKSCYWVFNAIFFLIAFKSLKDIQNTIFINLQVGGLIRLTFGAVLSFGLAHYGSSEFELMAEELLMSDSVVKASRTTKGLFLLEQLYFFHLGSVQVLSQATWFHFWLARCKLRTSNRVYYSFPLFHFFFFQKSYLTD